MNGQQPRAKSQEPSDIDSNEAVVGDDNDVKCFQLDEPDANPTERQREQKAQYD